MVVMALASAVLIPALFPAYVQYRRRTCAQFSQAGNRCMSRLTCLGRAIQVYATDHKGLCPPTLSALSPEYLAAGTDVFCPQTFCPYARRDGRIGEGMSTSRQAGSSAISPRTLRLQPTTPTITGSGAMCCSLTAQSFG